MNDFEQLHHFLDEEAEADIPIEEYLLANGLAKNEALEKSVQFRQRFWGLLKVYRLPESNVSALVKQLSELLSVTRNEDTIFLYTALATERGLLFEQYEDDEQKIYYWLKQSSNAEKLARVIQAEQMYRKRLQNLNFDTASSDTETDLEEQALLYQMALQHDFLYRGRRNNSFLENIGELVRRVNSHPELKEIKPYVYSAALSRKHKLMMERKGYVPNISNLFERTVYKIRADNGKNFDTYQSYLELYEQLQRHYEDEVDIAFSDYCFAHLSNLSDWYYENCEPNEQIPMTLERITEQLTTRIDLGSPEIMKEHPVLAIAYQNVLVESDWLDMIHAVQEGTPISDYYERLYEMADAARLCKDKELAMQYAQLHLNLFVEEYNRRLLVDAVKYF